MKMSKMLPLGIDDFPQLIKSGSYYVDKTSFIEEYTNSHTVADILSRPQGFGKTLNLSMLKSFYEIGADKTLFDGLYISNNKELCEEYMGKYPVIFLSFKEVKGQSFEEVCTSFSKVVLSDAKRYGSLLESDKLDEVAKQQYYWVLNCTQDLSYYNTPIFLLENLMWVLHKYYDQRVILLIDDFDLPLYQAIGQEYYDKMVAFFQSFFGMALKSNHNLAFGLLAGCMRLSQDIPCGAFNNFRIVDIDSCRFDGSFGFTNEDVEKLLEDYNLQYHFAKVKEWYGCYHFGKVELYRPKSIINYVDDLIKGYRSEPRSYLLDSSNDLVKRFIENGYYNTREEIVKMIDGKASEKKLHFTLEYSRIDMFIDNLWSVLYTTGYLTHIGDIDYDYYKLAIPNKEVREVFIVKLQECFKELIASDPEKINAFNTAVISGDVATIQSVLNDLLWDSFNIKGVENIYKGLILDLLAYQKDLVVRSNEENGEGHIIIRTTQDVGVVIRYKYANDGNLENVCAEAIQELKEKKLAESLQEQGMIPVLSYVIAFYRKNCMVVKA